MTREQARVDAAAVAADPLLHVGRREIVEEAKRLQPIADQLQDAMAEMLEAQQQVEKVKKERQVEKAKKKANDAQHRAQKCQLACTRLRLLAGQAPRLFDRSVDPPRLRSPKPQRVDKPAQSAGRK